MKTNYHTHSTFCDGKNTIEEIALSAIEKNFDILGFSSHSMYPFSSDWHLQTNNHQPYANEVRRIQELYKDKIEIMLGFEADFIEGFCCPRKDVFSIFNPDYLIGAVHFVNNEKGIFAVDDSAENVKKGLQDIFNNNNKEFVHAYYEAQRKMLDRGDFDIIAHAELILKHNGTLHFFDENESWYKEELKLTASKIAQSGVIVEINVGGMARGYIKNPYPSRLFLNMLKDKNVPVTINSDSHQVSTLDFSFDYAMQYAKDAGYSEIAYIKDKSVKFTKI